MAKANTSYPFQVVFERDLSIIAGRTPHVDGIQITRIIDFMRTVVIRINYDTGLSDSKRIGIENRIQETLRDKSYIQSVDKNLIVCIPEDKSCPAWPGFVIGELLVMFVDVPTDPSIHPWPTDSTLTATNLGTTSLTLTWTNIRDGASIDSYRIFGSNNLFAVVSNVTHAFLVTGLSPGTLYTFNVGATNDNGDFFAGPSTSVSTNTVTSNPPQSTPTGGPPFSRPSNSPPTESFFLRYWYAAFGALMTVIIATALLSRSKAAKKSLAGNTN